MMTTLFPEVSVVFAAAAVLSWPSPDPVHRLPMLKRDRSRWRGSLGAAWWVIPALVGTLLLGAHVALAAVMVARTGVSAVRRHRQRKEETEGGAAIARLAEALAGELSSGAAPLDALDLAAREVPGRFRGTAVALATRIRFGSSGDGASAVEPGRFPPSVLRSLRGVRAAWRLSERHGVPLSSLAHGLRADAMGRHAHRSSVNASLAGPRATMMILAALPVLGIGMGQLLGAGPLTFLFGGGLGGWVLLAGTVAACAGVLWSQRILATAEGIS